jgi:membrane associated rhomboid family serine protease/Flp pilus assembly protein TadD
MRTEKSPEAPKIDQEEVPAQQQQPQSDLPEWLKVTGKPVLIKALLILNTVMFAAMAGASGIKSMFIPSSQVLLHFGASSGASTIIDGEFWRAVSSAFVHIGFLHLMMNCYIIWDIGPLVVKLYGARKFMVIYLLSAVGASLTSLMFDPTVVSAGASGAIFGMFGALVAFFWWHNSRFPAGFLKPHAKIIVIFIIYGIAYGAIMQGVDNAAHIGGLLTGFAVALSLVPLTPGETAYRQQDAVVTAALGVCFLALLAADCKSIARNGYVMGDAAYQKAVEFMQNQNPSDALPLLDSAVALMPDVASVHRDRARAYDMLGRGDEAASECDEAIRLEPKNKAGFIVRAAVYHNLGKEKESIADLSTEIELDPKNAMAYNNRAWSYNALGDFVDALKDSDTAIAMDHNVATFYDTRAVALYTAGRLTEALNDLNKAMMLKHTDGAFAFHRARVYQKLGQTQLADDELKRSQALGFRPENWETRND